MQRAQLVPTVTPATKLVMTGIDDGREVLLFWGRTSSGRPIVVTVRPDDDEDDDTAIVGYLIRSVYDMRTYELGLFTEWENNR